MEIVLIYMIAASQSAVQVTTPFVLAGHVLSLLSSDLEVDKVVNEWHTLDNIAHAALVSNVPRCRASLSQGQSMLRRTKKQLPY